MNAHITKPIEPRELFEALVTWIEPGEREVPDLALAEDELEAASEALPQIEGVDVEAAVARVGGSVTSYKRLLEKFVDNQADAISRLTVSLDSGDAEEAARIAHTLKGLGGTIGAPELQSAAASLEAALREKGTDVSSELIAATERELEQVLGAVRPVVEVAGDGAPPTSGTLSAEELKASLDQLATMLGEYDTEAEDLVEQIAGSGPEAQIGEALDEVKRRLGEYDFDGASEVLTAALAAQSDEG
jgi:HPt (histidine-containing phosphotransfer) domain-containing protein